MKSEFFAKAASAAAFAVAMAANAAIYNAETTQAWFDVDVSTLTDGALSASPWTPPANGGTATMSEGVIALDTDLDEELNYAPATSDPGTDGHRVTARLKVAIHDDASSLAALNGAQASIAPALDGGNPAWYGWNGSWVKLTGAVPVSDTWYDVMIEFKTVGESKYVRYSIKTTAASEYTVLSYNDNQWLANGNPSATAITALAFSGSGSIDDFGAVGVTPTSSYSVTGDAAGFNFTNRTISVAVADAKAGTSLQAVVKDSSGTTVATTAAVSVTGDGTYTLAVDPAAGLAPGARYDYVIQVVDGGVPASTGVGGSFVSANWDESTWFGTRVVASEPQSVNGSWTVAPSATNTASYGISGDAVFAVTDGTPGSGKVSRVDTVINYSSFADTDDLEADATSYSGIVAATNSTAGGAAAWWAISSGGEWVQLSGVVPVADIDYVLRAEFDFLAATPAVRYLVSSDAGSTFTALSAAGSEWLALAKSGETLSSVQASGSGTLASITANVTDANVAKIGSVGYATLEAALAAGGNVTLLTDVFWSPATAGTFTIDKNGNTFLVSPADGVKMTVDGNTYTVELGYFEVGVIAGSTTNMVMYLTNALATAADNVSTTNVLLRSVQLASAVEIAASKKIVLDLSTNELYGAAITLATGGSLEVYGGFVGLAALPANVLTGGKTLDNSTIALPEGYSYVGLAENVTVNGHTYRYQVTKGSSEDTEGKTAYEVDVGGESGSIAISADALEALGIDTAGKTPAQISAALDALGENGLPKWESYVLGLDATSASSKPFAAPVQSESASSVRFSLEGVAVAAGSGATVQYSVQTLASPNAEPTASTEFVDASQSIDVPLSSDGVKYYRIQVKVTPAN